MPAVSERQRKFMAMCAHSPSKAKGKCPPKKVVREFSFKKKMKVPRKDKNGYY